MATLPFPADKALDKQFPVCADGVLCCTPAVYTIHFKLGGWWHEHLVSLHGIRMVSKISCTTLFVKNQSNK